MDCRVILYLQQTADGPPLQFWSFDNEVLIRIGRSLDNQVVVANPYISRAHAYILLRDDGTWCVNSISNQGLVYGKVQTDSIPLTHGTVFRLGKSGPFLRFARSSELSTDMDTLQHVESPRLSPSALVLDEARLSREVDEIAQSKFFRELMAKVSSLRSGPGDRGESAGPPSPDLPTRIPT